MTDLRLHELEKDNVANELMKFIPNVLGINLCSVDDISILRQKDGQIVDITLKFNPSN